MERYDLVIAGGGFGGSGLATVMSRAGYRCLVLEKTTEFVDRTKGEWIAPWGVVEAERAGLLGDIERARGHTIRRHVRLGASIDPDQALAEAMPLNVVAGVEGPLAQRHPDVCQTLFDAAGDAGADTRRGVDDIDVVPGIEPTVTYRIGDTTATVAARLVVGADGRNSSVRRKLGLELHRDPPHHLFSGLLVDDVPDWPDDLEMIATVDDLHFLAFPQGQGRVRLYLGFALDRARFVAGPDGPRRFVEAFGVDCFPYDRAFTKGVPAGPCATYSNESSWVDDPTAVEGVVFVADAAGADDPVTGQGLSITLRDIRVVTELLRTSPDWSPGALAPYAEERRERMRRLRFASGLISIFACEFGAEAERRRVRFSERSSIDRTLGAGRLAAFLGPDALPAAAFSDTEWQRALA